MPAHRALVIGRFQPPHNGHLECIRAAAEEAEEVIVAIGSAQRSHTHRDPFTAGERIEMLAVAVDEAGLPVRHIVPIPDLDQYHLWVAQVAAYMPPFDLVVTGSPMTEHLFQMATIPVHRIRVTERDRFQGKVIRQRLFAGKDIQDVVPPPVAAFLEQDDLRERLRALAAAAEGNEG